MAKLNYKTRLSRLKKGNRPCYQAWVAHNGTISKDEIVRSVAQRSGLSEAMVNCVLELFYQTIQEDIAKGFRFDAGQLGGGAYIQGAFESLDDQWNPDRHRLVVRLNAKGSLRSALKGHTPVNVTDGAKVSVRSVLDEAHAEDGMIIGVTDVSVQVSGTGLSVDAAAEDEGCWLANAATGAIVAQATVTDSSDTMLDCTFGELPPDGEYMFVVASRGGLGAGYGVAMGRKRVLVKSSPDA